MAYAVIYDFWDAALEDWIESFYEAFNSEEEAEKMFLDATVGIRNLYHNPRIVSIGKAIVAPEGSKWG